MISVGKINVAKLANFQDIDVFVMVACPENSLVDSKEFIKPIVTPFELEIALVPEKQWTNRYLTDFRSLLPELEADLVALARDNGRMADKDASDDETHVDVSLVSNKICAKVRRRPHRMPMTDEAVPQAVVVRDQQRAVALVDSADSFQKRTFRGLEPRIGQTPVVLPTEGRRGIARGYKDEPKE